VLGGVGVKCSFCRAPEQKIYREAMERTDRPVTSSKNGTCQKLDGVIHVTMRKWGVDMGGNVRRVHTQTYIVRVCSLCIHVHVRRSVACMMTQLLLFFSV
ncbi:unnamed protein product, partial [Ectocarpus sp. 12 AP-2014]